MRHRRQRSGSADVRHDVFEDRLDLLGRELVCDRPARRPGHHAEPLLLVEAIHLHNNAVGLVRQFVTLLAPVPQKPDYALDVQPFLTIRIDGQAQGDKSGQCLRLACDHWQAVRAVLDELIAPRRQPPCGGHARILLPERAGAAVPRICVRRQARFLALGVDPGEFGLWHVDLAADLGRDRLAQPFRQGGDRPQVGGHILASGAVAACRALHEAAALVAERDGEAVDLELGDVAELEGRPGGGRQAQPTPHPTVEGAQLILVEDIAQREHRPPVDDLAEGAYWSRADALSRRVGHRQRRECGFDGHQLAHQPVVLSVGEIGGVGHVVQLVGSTDGWDQLVATVGGGLLTQFSGILYRIEGDRQPDRPFARLSHLTLLHRYSSGRFSPIPARRSSASCAVRRRRVGAVIHDQPARGGCERRRPQPDLVGVPPGPLTRLEEKRVVAPVARIWRIGDPHVGQTAKRSRAMDQGPTAVEPMRGNCSVLAVRQQHRPESIHLAEAPALVHPGRLELRKPPISARPAGRP